MMRYGAKALPEGGWNTQPQLYFNGGAHRRRRGELREFDAAQGHSSRDAERHAGGRGGVRRRARRRRARRRRCAATRSWSMRARSRPSSIPCATSTRRLPAASMPGSMFAGLAMITGGRMIEDLHGEPGHKQHAAARRTTTASQKRDILTGIECGRARSQDHLRQGHQRALLGHAARRGSAGRICWCTPRCATRSAATSTATRACGSARPTSTRWSTTARAGDGCRSTPRTACTARRATSWIPYGVITWVPPEGGGGPQYDGM